MILNDVKNGEREKVKIYCQDKIEEYISYVFI